MAPQNTKTRMSGCDNKGFSQDENTSKQNEHKNVENISIIAGPSSSKDNLTIQATSRTSQKSATSPETTTFPNGYPSTRRPSPVPVSPTGEKLPQKIVYEVKLKRSLNLWYCTAITIAVTGHSSIFISPSNIIDTSGSLGSALVIWVVGGLINMGTALCFAELGTMYPKGGPFHLAMTNFGPMVGFLLLWGYTILIAAPFWAFLSYTAALYMVRPIFPDCLTDDVQTAIKLLAGWILVSMVVINCVYMKYVTRFQTLLSSCKVVALLILIGAGINNLAKGKTENFENLFSGTTGEPGKIALAFFYSIFSYGGWQVMTTMLEEMKNPSRDPPLSVIISFAVVITKYILTNVAYATLMTREEIIASPAVALDFTDRLYGPLVPVISVLVSLTSIGALNASIMGHSRLLFGGARSGQLPQILGMIHVKYLTPWPSIFLFTLISLAMLFSGSVTDIMDFMALFATSQNLVVISSLLHYRWARPDFPRPYKPWLWIPIVEMLINFSLLVLSIYQKPQKMGIALAILFSGVPVYLFGNFYKSFNVPGASMLDDFTATAQKLLMITKTKES